MRSCHDNSNAVSPVVGVMLMLAVTIMLAAVVSTYAGGFSDSADKSPQSSIRATPDLGLHRIYFEHNGGDTFTIRSINVILRSGDNTTTLSANDIGSKLEAFEEVGSSGDDFDTAVKTGDTFYIEGDDAGSGAGLKFGKMVLANNTKISWLVVDKASSRAISRGDFYL